LAYKSCTPKEIIYNPNTNYDRFLNRVKLAKRKRGEDGDDRERRGLPSNKNRDDQVDIVNMETYEENEIGIGEISTLFAPSSSLYTDRPVTRHKTDKGYSTRISTMEENDIIYYVIPFFDLIINEACSRYVKKAFDYIIDVKMGSTMPDWLGLLNSSMEGVERVSEPVLELLKFYFDMVDEQDRAGGNQTRFNQQKYATPLDTYRSVFDNCVDIRDDDDEARLVPTEHVIYSIYSEKQVFISNHQQLEEEAKRTRINATRHRADQPTRGRASRSKTIEDVERNTDEEFQRTKDYLSRANIYWK
jgi:hypothetical protein